MSTWIEPPPPKTGMGCVGKGCLLVVCFFVFLAMAAGVGLFIGMKTHSAIVRGMWWARKTQLVAEQPVLVPTFDTTRENIIAARRKWDDFENAEGPAHIELTADDINNLIANDDETRGRVFVSMEGDRLRVQTSYPIGEHVGGSKYYINGDFSVQVEGAQPFDNPHFKSVMINQQSIPTNFVDWKYRGRPLRLFFGEWKNREHRGTFELRDGKLIIDKTSR